MDLDDLAKCFHEAYEQLAPEHGMAPFGVAEWGAPGMAKRRAFIRAVVTKTLQDMDKPIITYGRGPTACNSAALHATTGHTSQSQMYTMDPATNAVTYVLNEDRVRVLIREEIASAEDRIVKRTVAYLTDHLRLSGHVRDER